MGRACRPNRDPFQQQPERHAREREHGRRGQPVPARVLRHADARVRIPPREVAHVPGEEARVAKDRLGPHDQRVGATSHQRADGDVVRAAVLDAHARAGSRNDLVESSPCAKAHSAPQESRATSSEPLFAESSSRERARDAESSGGGPLPSSCSSPLAPVQDPAARTGRSRAAQFRQLRWASRGPWRALRDSTAGRSSAVCQARHPWFQAPALPRKIRVVVLR